MKYFKLLSAILLLIPALSFADTYDVSISGATDQTPASVNYIPNYDVKIVVGTNPALDFNDRTSPNGVFSITAAPGDTIKVSMRNKNTKDGIILGNYSPEVTALAPVPPTTPVDMNGSFTMTITRTGP